MAINVLTTQPNPRSLSDIQVDVKAFGATGDGVTDDTAAFTAFLTELQTGKDGFIPSGTYLIKSPIDLTVTGDISITCVGTAVIKGHADIGANPILDFSGPAAETYVFRWSGGVIDNSAVPYSAAAQSGTCLALTRFYRVIIEGCSFLGDTDYTTALTNLHGDSGITAVDCRYVSITNNYFFAQPDLGIYGSGNSNAAASDDGGQYAIVGNHFAYCKSGISLKRQLGDVTISSNTFYRCEQGVLPLPTTDMSGTDRTGGPCSIIGNTFKFIAKTSIELRQGWGSTIVGNEIEDWGYTLSDTQSTLGCAIRILGASSNVVSSNVCRLKEWSNINSHHQGLNINDETYDSTLYTPEDNLAIGNLFDGVEKGIVEVSGSGANTFSGNKYVSVTTPETIVNANTHSDYFLGINGVYYRTGTKVSTSDGGALLVYNDNDLSLENNSISAVISLDTDQLVIPYVASETISNGSITVTGTFQRVDTESAASTDDLDTITAGTTGQVVILKANADARTVVVKNGTGNLALSADMTLDTYTKTITLIYDNASSSWIEIARQ